MSDLYEFHSSIYARPDDRPLSPGVIELRGQTLRTLENASGGPPVFDAALPVSFEQAQSRLMQIDRMDCEPDGYFLVAGGEGGGRRWQVDGHMFEFNDRLHRIEVHGACPPALFDQLLASLGWPEAPLVFELVHEAVTLDEAEFRRWAGAGGTGASAV